MSHPLTAAANAGLFIVSAVLYSCAGYGPVADPRAASAMHRRTLRTTPSALAVAGAALLAYSRRNDR